MLTVRRQKKVGVIGLRQPFDFIYLFFDFQRLEVIEFRLMTSERAVDIVLDTTLSGFRVQVVRMVVDTEL